MCSLRSWPTQKPRPVPVSTTQRTSGSSDAWVTAASSDSLVATSRLFIASGRLRVIVVTPSVWSTSTGSVMAGRLVQAPRDEPVRGGLEPVGLAGEHRRRLASRPVAGEQLVGQPRVGEEELPPLVHQVEAGGERRLVGVAGTGLRGDQPLRLL